MGVSTDIKVAAQAPVALWYTRCPVPTGFGLALQSGLLEDEFRRREAASLTAVQDSPDRAVRQSHYTHTQPNSFRHGGAYPALWAQANGADTKVIGLSRVRTRQTILTLPDSPINSARDLAGRRVLLLRRPHEPIDFNYLSGLRTLDAAARSAGLCASEIVHAERVVDSAFIDDRPAQRSLESGEPGLKRNAISAWPQTLFPLVRGEVDAIVAGGPQAVELEYLAGLKVVFDQGDLPLREQSHNSLPLVFTVNADLVRERPDLVLRVLRTALQAEELARKDPGLARRLVARELGISERLAGHAYGEGLAGDLTLDFAPDKIAALKAEAAFLHEQGALPRPVDVDAWLEPGLLDAARRGRAS